MPDVSVTIIPTGAAYEAAREIIDALHRQCPDPACSWFEPHVTIQFVYGADDVDRVVRIVEGVCRRTLPFPIRLGELGMFESVPGIHVDLEPTPPLLGLYVRLKKALNALGFRTYDYDERSWHPHLTLSCRHWSAENVEQMRSMFGSFDVEFLAERLQVSRLENGAWVPLRDLSLGRARRSTRRSA